MLLAGTSTCCCSRCSISCAFATLLLELHTVPSRNLVALLLTMRALDPNIMVLQIKCRLKQCKTHVTFSLTSFVLSACSFVAVCSTSPRASAS